MDFKPKKDKIPQIIGYTIMYFIFTTILFFILILTDKLPINWNYFHVLIITLFIILLGRLIKLLLK